ncbi:MAG TPA: DUF4442 domain-containing protein [Candidatus Polarisedimenticolaceae bacterium]|nr:DUF4442 domain-containing protein [Candidatus Polarisedimenticolaceae bacterium]
MPESWRSRLARWGFNWFPAYRGTGARIEYVASDWREVRIRLPLNWRTRNYVGTIFGGGLYGAIDPIYMIMLIKILGPDYVVWDKAATIRFKKPGRSTLYTTFILTDAEIDGIKADVARDGRTERIYVAELKDGEGNVAMSCDKLISIKKSARSP